MEIFHHWLSISGSKTEDNRDFCGIRKSEKYNIYILADGSTNTQNSSNLAKELVNEITTNLNPQEDQEALISQLKDIHTKIRFKYTADTASFLLVIHFVNGKIISLHSGDCLLGTIHDTTITWQTTPHTLANATSVKSHKELADDPQRNILTRTFNGRRFCRPEVNLHRILTSSSIIIATDGFWADLSEVEQLKVTEGKRVESKESDDISCLIIKTDAPNSHWPNGSSGNLIVINEDLGKKVGTKIAEKA